MSIEQQQSTPASVDVEKLATNEGMTQLVEQGKKHMAVLFDYKSVVNVLVQVKGDAENKKELYQKNLEVLDPQVQRMRDLASYNDVIVSVGASYIQKIGKSDKPPTDQELELIIQLLDVFVILDYLKTWQAGLNNDFSMYRRAVTHVKKDYNAKDDESLRFFLIHPNNINKGLKKALQDKVKGYEKTLIFALKYCQEQFEKDEQQHHFLRIAVFTIYLIDQVFAIQEQVANIKKQVKLFKTCKLFEKYPKITLYKNLPFNVSNYLKSAPNWTENQDDFAKAPSKCTLL